MEISFNLRKMKLSYDEILKFSNYDLFEDQISNTTFITSKDFYFHDFTSYPNSFKNLSKQSMTACGQKI